MRTGLDLGCHLRRREAFAALSGLARAHGLTAADYAAQLPRFRRRRGVCQLRDLVGLVDPRLESAREAWTLLELHDSGLPLPTPQLEVVVDGDLFRLDLAYPWAKVAVEYDGHEWHTLTAEQRHADEHRRRLLEAAGWLVVVVRRGDFTGAARDRWIGMVRDALTPTYSNRRF